MRNEGREPLWGMVMLLAAAVMLVLAMLSSCATLPPNTDRCEWRCWRMLEHCRGEWPPRACGEEQLRCEERCRR